MTSRNPQTFEEKINAILKHREHTHRWSKPRFLPKFAYLPDEELESLLQLGREIEQYACEVAKAARPDYVLQEGDGRLPAISKAISSRYAYLDAERARRLTGRAIYYVMK